MTSKSMLAIAGASALFAISPSFAAPVAPTVGNYITTDFVKSASGNACGQIALAQGDVYNSIFHWPGNGAAGAQFRVGFPGSTKSFVIKVVLPKTPGAPTGGTQAWGNTTTTATIQVMPPPGFPFPSSLTGKFSATITYTDASSFILDSKYHYQGTVLGQQASCQAEVITTAIME